MSRSDENGRSARRIPTRRIEAAVRLAEGRSLRVVFFLAAAAKTHGGPESVDEFLNRSRRFLPARLAEADEPVLVRRDGIRTVAVGDDAPVLFRLQETGAACIDFVRLELGDGLVVEGSVATVLPPESPRLSDYFNEPSDFVAVDTDEGLVYVNKAHVRLIRL